MRDAVSAISRGLKSRFTVDLYLHRALKHQPEKGQKPIYSTRNIRLKNSVICPISNIKSIS